MPLFNHALGNLRSSRAIKSPSSRLSSNFPCVGSIQRTEADTAVPTPGSIRAFTCRPDKLAANWDVSGEAASPSCPNVPFDMELVRYICGMPVTIIMCLVCSGETGAFLYIVCQMLHRLFTQFCSLKNQQQLKTFITRCLN